MYLIGGQLQREAYRRVGSPPPGVDPEEFRLAAYTYLSLVDTGDQGRFDRASTCRPQIYRFYAPDGALETHTPSCSGRGTAHSQMAQIVDWDRIVEMDEELYELITRPNPPSWQEVMAKAKPDISQADVRVYCTCVTGDTKVLTDQGWRSVYSLAEPLVIGNYTRQYVVDGARYFGTPPFFKGMENTYRVAFSNGLDVCATADHRFLTYSVTWDRGKKIEKREWKQLKDLEEGDRLLLTDNAWSVKEPDADFWEGFVIGVLMGDGTLFNTGFPDLQLLKKDAQEIADLLANAGVVRDVKPLNGRSGLRVSFNHRAMELIHKFSFRNKESVEITNEQQLQGYISGLIVTDGSVARRDIQIQGGYSYLRQLAEYMLAFGRPFFNMIKVREAGESTNLATATKDAWKLSITAPSLRRMLLVLTQDKQDGVGAICAATAYDKPPTTKVVSISYAGRRAVYDISVPGITRFVANGVIAHNCEDFLYSGAAYFSTSTNSAVPGYEESRVPTRTWKLQIRNMVCKHLIAVYYDFFEFG